MSSRHGHKRTRPSSANLFSNFMIPIITAVLAAAGTAGVNNIFQNKELRQAKADIEELKKQQEACSQDSIKCHTDMDAWSQKANIFSENYARYISYQAVRHLILLIVFADPYADWGSQGRAYSYLISKSVEIRLPETASWPTIRRYTASTIEPKSNALKTLLPPAPTRNWFQGRGRKRGIFVLAREWLVNKDRGMHTECSERSPQEATRFRRVWFLIYPDCEILDVCAA